MKKKADHKHVYRKIILHFGGSTFSWGRTCEICGRIDSTFKASYWRPQDFKVTGDGLSGSWKDICLSEIHNKYPEYKIMTLGMHAEWTEWKAN